MALAQDQYPIQLSVDYPDRPLSRFSSFFRLIAVIPIAIVLAVVSSWSGADVSGWSGAEVTAGVTAGALFLAPLLMILFRQKYPRWWFDWNVELLRFENRVIAYLLLLRDEYPSTDEEQSVHLEVPYPDVPQDLNRWLPLVKWILALPHYIVLFVLGIVAVVVAIIAWFAILFTSRYPRDLFNYIEGVLRWGARVTAYAFLMTTDRYPPFRLSP